MLKNHKLVHWLTQVVISSLIIFMGHRSPNSIYSTCTTVSDFTKSLAGNSCFRVQEVPCIYNLQKKQVKTTLSKTGYLSAQCVHNCLRPYKFDFDLINLDLLTEWLMHRET